MSFTVQTNVTATTEQKTFPALFVDCPFLTGTPKCEFKYTAPCDVCSPWHAPPGFHTDMQNGIGSMQPGDGCVSCRGKLRQFGIVQI